MCGIVGYTGKKQAQDYLPMLFGQNGYARVHRPQELVHRLAQIHAALVSR